MTGGALVSLKPPSHQSGRTLNISPVQVEPVSLEEMELDAFHLHVQIVQPRVEIWILSSHWLSRSDQKQISS